MDQYSKAKKDAWTSHHNGGIGSNELERRLNDAHDDLLKTDETRCQNWAEWKRDNEEKHGK